jgi:hypothetical protein
MSQTLPDISDSKALPDDKGSLDVLPLDTKQASREPDSLEVLAPPTDEPVVTRRELWSYYCAYRLELTFKFY